jgi:hypothetical protein
VLGPSWRRASRARSWRGARCGGEGFSVQCFAAGAPPRPRGRSTREEAGSGRLGHCVSRAPSGSGARVRGCEAGAGRRERCVQAPWACVMLRRGGGGPQERRPGRWGNGTRGPGRSARRLLLSHTLRKGRRRRPRQAGPAPQRQAPCPIRARRVARRPRAPPGGCGGRSEAACGEGSRTIIPWSVLRPTPLAKGARGRATARGEAGRAQGAPRRRQRGQGRAAGRPAGWRPGGGSAAR